MAILEISGNLRDRFIQAAVLLHTLDPVRGEPTGHGIDEDALDISCPRERMLKRKFLDSFALVCATQRDGDRVSAACMEEGAPEGTVIRIASNSGFTTDVLTQLRAIVDALNDIASQGMRPLSTQRNIIADIGARETDILFRIIRLDIVKIRNYIKDLRTTKDIFDDPIAALESRIIQSLNLTPDADLHKFLDWFRHIFEIRDLPLSPEPAALVPFVRWAQRARKYYIECLRDAFSTKTGLLPKWICTVFKIGRYGIASRALVQLASEFPALFNPMIVETVTAPSKTHFVPLSDEMCLGSVLRRIFGICGEEYIPRLISIWGTADGDGHFRRACTLSLSVHAEMQLISFYDHNRQSKPSLQFIGVSSCHQKLYPSWFPPPAVDRSVYIRYKAIVTELSKVMEATAKQELENRLGSIRRPVPADSTAGVSLSGLTEPGAAQAAARETIDLRASNTVGKDVAMEEDTTADGRALESGVHLQQIDTVKITELSQEAEPGAIDEMRTVAINDHFADERESSPSSMMVIHFMRADNPQRQDIVSIGDIFDHLSGRPSWTKLVDILKAKDGFGLAFDAGNEVLWINNQICVSNERQFLACLQYLRNSNLLNAEAFVYGTSDA